MRFYDLQERAGHCPTRFELESYRFLGTSSGTILLNADLGHGGRQMRKRKTKNAVEPQYHPMTAFANL